MIHVLPPAGLPEGGILAGGSPSDMRVAGSSPLRLLAYQPRWPILPVLFLIKNLIILAGLVALCICLAGPWLDVCLLACTFLAGLLAMAEALVIRRETGLRETIEQARLILLSQGSLPEPHNSEDAHV